MTADIKEVERIFQDSEAFAEQLFSLIQVPLFDDSDKIRVSDMLCSLSLEHWHSIRLLLSQGLLPSALVVHRSQFEAVVRSIWSLYGATDTEVGKLSETVLNTESEQAAKNLPQVQAMLEVLSKKAPPQAYEALERFRVHNWKALNSYTHAGLHPLRRHEDGYPVQLVVSALQNANGLAVIACMQAVVLGGVQLLQKAILDLASKFQHCMPTPL